MSNLHLACYLTQARPQLQHNALTELPLQVLGPALSSQLQTSLTSNGYACAKSARLWERILDLHRLPFLLLRVADMRMTLGSPSTALALYAELQTVLPDPQFESWLRQVASAAATDARTQLHAYKHSPSLGFTQSQRWRSTSSQVDAAFPTCKLQQSQFDEIHSIWADIGPSDLVLEKYINYHCLETNVIEGTFQFSPSASTRLIEVGFYDQAEPLLTDQSIIGGAVRNRADALSVLQDTHRTLKEIFTLLNSDTLTLTVATICRLHKMLMETSQVLYINRPYGPQLSYLNIGITRQISRVNVTAAPADGAVKIQFCPYDEVNAELSTFCHRFNELIQQADIDPFAAAAWISHVFVTIHPFEDGNGRLSRMLASIPLLKKGLPPICIPASFKNYYIQRLNALRADRDGDYRAMMEMLCRATRSSLEILAGTIM